MIKLTHNQNYLLYIGRIPNHCNYDAIRELFKDQHDGTRFTVEYCKQNKIKILDCRIPIKCKPIKEGNKI